MTITADDLHVLADEAEEAGNYVRAHQLRTGPRVVLPWWRWREIGWSESRRESESRSGGGGRYGSWSRSRSIFGTESKSRIATTK